MFLLKFTRVVFQDFFPNDLEFIFAIIGVACLSLYNSKGCLSFHYYLGRGDSQRNVLILKVPLKSGIL